MINIKELKNKIKPVFEAGREEQLLDYLVALIKDDIIKIVNDINTIATYRPVSDNLYYLYVRAIVSESDSNILEIVDLYNYFTTTTKLEGIKVDLKKDELLKNTWAGPIITPIFSDEDMP